MAYTVMAYTLMAYTFMAYIDMAYIVMAIQVPRIEVVVADGGLALSDDAATDAVFHVWPWPAKL